jgi:hypothetical protein
MLQLKEETQTTRRAANPLGAFLNAKERDKQAYEQHKNIFDTDNHVDRVAAVCDKINEFFGRNPNYITRRGLGRRKPFEAIKISDVGTVLSRTPMPVKARFYESLTQMGKVEVNSTNGHLIVRVFA